MHPKPADGSSVGPGFLRFLDRTSTQAEAPGASCFVFIDSLLPQQIAWLRDILAPDVKGIDDNLPGALNISGFDCFKCIAMGLDGSLESLGAGQVSPEAKAVSLTATSARRLCRVG